MVVNKKNFLILNHGSPVTYLVEHSGRSWELVAFSHAVALMRDLHARSREKNVIFFFLFCFLPFMPWNVREMENREVFFTLCTIAQWKCYWWNILVSVFKTYCMVCKYCDCRFVIQPSRKLFDYYSIFAMYQEYIFQEIFFYYYFV